MSEANIHNATVSELYIIMGGANYILLLNTFAPLNSYVKGHIHSR